MTMSTAKSSPLLKVLGISAVAAVLLIVFQYAMRDKPTGLEDKVPTVPTLPGDLDETSETIRTLSAEMRSLRNELEAISIENKTLQKESSELKETLRFQEEERNTKVVEQNEKSDNLIDQIAGRLDEAWQQTAPGSSEKTEVPVSGEAQRGTKTVWILPLGYAGGPSSAPMPIGDKGGGEAGLISPAADFIQKAALPIGGKPEAAATIPVHTIPANATLIESTLMTALIGRVPIGETVTDPFPFKVLFGAENLASNGIKIPGVVGMVASGYTKGDWGLACVRGDVNSMTFTFEDGTIHTVKDKGTLGYLSDPAGVPCISGNRISNVGTYLAGRVAAAAGEGIAESFARSAVDERIGLFGGTAKNVKDPSRLAAASMAADASREFKEYLEGRLSNTFDAVYVPPAEKVAIHIQEEIPIDFNPSGRKVFHGDVSSTASLKRLD
ncbi:MAG: TIGR03752 family integrating conjugative element protein [Gammaproteobacteria bacterium]|nr:TIGR03752 family integrating conjugative element protein [Gammaproteobacteria bacterium]